MTPSTSRHEAIRAIAEQRLPAMTIKPGAEPARDVFGRNVFSPTVMRSALPKDAYEALLRTSSKGEPLDLSVADIVANAMKDWAIEHGATHYCHWFQPLTGLTAEKHDSFLVPTGDGQALVEFSGKTLIKGEPDASSLPSGGTRSTFEARGYTAWDPTSPAYIVNGVNGKTLCIPTAFCSYDGTALDKKTPLLRSIAALNTQALRMLRLFGNHVAKRVHGTVGSEQEYFLVDRRFYYLRPDLINAGRTLFGARPPKGQEMEDHYFGSIKERVLAYMMDAERTLYEIGIPIKTRHNEVAPGQFEIAPVHEETNIATDHNMITMEVLKNTALKHGLKCLMHEKPFAGINGSGKHNNWSLCDDDGNNLLEPGNTPHDNAQFLVFLTAVIRAAHLHSDLLRASVACAGNDHRLGANEAPPAILSIYLGDKLMQIVQGIIVGKQETGRECGTLEIGISSLPPLPLDDSDRNRTSPFAFTGNKFEFRAVGSSQSIAGPNTVLNTIVADTLAAMADEIEKETQSGMSFEAAMQKVVRQSLQDHQAILFNGDNYSKDWVDEAAKRGLPNVPSSVDAIEAWIELENKALFARHGVYAESEMDAGYLISLESYVKTISIEAQITANMARTMILPAAMTHQKNIADCLIASREAIPSCDNTAAEKCLEQAIHLTATLITEIDALDTIRPQGDQNGENHRETALFYRDQIVPAMNKVREAADILEIIVEDQLWPIPKYRELLFVY